MFSASAARMRPATCQPLQPNPSVGSVASSLRQRSNQHRNSLTPAKRIISSILRRCDDVYSATPLRPRFLLLHWASHCGIPSVQSEMMPYQLTCWSAQFHHTRPVPGVGSPLCTVPACLDARKPARGLQPPRLHRLTLQKFDRPMACQAQSVTQDTAKKT